MEPIPERKQGISCNSVFQDTVCVESGSYMVNFAGCSQCNKKEEIRVNNREEDFEEEEESVRYQRKYSRASII